MLWCRPRIKPVSREWYESQLDRAVGVTAALVGLAAAFVVYPFGVVATATLMFALVRATPERAEREAGFAFAAILGIVAVLAVIVVAAILSADKVAVAVLTSLSVFNSATDVVGYHDARLGSVNAILLSAAPIASYVILPFVYREFIRSPFPMFYPLPEISGERGRLVFGLLLIFVILSIFVTNLAISPLLTLKVFPFEGTNANTPLSWVGLFFAVSVLALSTNLLLSLPRLISGAWRNT